VAQPPGRSPNYQQILLDRGLTESQLANPLVQAAIGGLGSAGDDHNTIGISTSFRNEFEPNQFAGWRLAAEGRRGLQQIRVGIGTIAAGYVVQHVLLYRSSSFHLRQREPQRP